MLVLKALYLHLFSLLKCLSGDFDKALHFAKKSAVAYMRSKTVYSSKALELHLLRCAERLIPAGLVSGLPPREESRVGILASTIFDVGGHTECLMRFAESFHAEYDLRLFLTNTSGDSRFEAKTKFAYLEQILKITSLEGEGVCALKITALSRAIVESRVKMLFVYMHMDDVVSSAALSYLSRHTDVKIVFFNHGDHTFSLGFEPAHLIIELRRQGQFITHKYRHRLNTTLIPLQGVKTGKMRSFGDQELQDKRRELGVGPDDLITLSGFSSYKVFKDRSNEYLTMIRDLLAQEERCKHILVTEISAKDRSKTIDKVFRGQEHLLKRLLVLDRVVEFDLLLQVADLFIDSFPLGSALVHIDAIRNRLPTMIKKNSRNEAYTFYNYLYEGYEYAVESVDEMLEKTLFLLRNKQEREVVAQRCFRHYLDTYEFETIKAQYKLLIDNPHSLERFYTPLPSGYVCRISSRT